MNLPNYDAWKTRSPYEDGEKYSRFLEKAVEEKLSAFEKELGKVFLKDLRGRVSFEVGEEEDARVYRDEAGMPTYSFNFDVILRVQLCDTDELEELAVKLRRIAAYLERK